MRNTIIRTTFAAVVAAALAIPAVASTDAHDPALIADREKSAAARELYNALYGEPDSTNDIQENAYIIDDITSEFQAPPDEAHRRKFVDAVMDSSLAYGAPVLKVWRCMENTGMHRFAGLTIEEAAAMCARSAVTAR